MILFHSINMDRGYGIVTSCRISWCGLCWSSGCFRSGLFCVLPFGFWQFDVGVGHCANWQAWLLFLRGQGFGLLGPVVPWLRAFPLGYPEPSLCRSVSLLRSVGLQKSGVFYRGGSSAICTSLRSGRGPFENGRAEAVMSGDARTPSCGGTALPDLRHKARSHLDGVLVCLQLAYPWAASLLQWLLEAVDGFCRTFFLLQLLALSRMFWMAIPLRRRKPMSNSVVRGHRTLLQGAPLIIAVAVCLPFVEAAPKGVFSRCLTSGASGAAVVDLDDDQAGFARPSSLLHVDAPGDGLHEVPMAPITPSRGESASLDRGVSSPTFSRVREQGWDVPVAVLHSQRLSRFTSVHSACMADAADLVEAVEYACDAMQHGRRFYEICPQPSLDFPVLLATSLRHESLGRVPVCMQLHDCSGNGEETEPRVWMEYCETPLRSSDVEEMLSQDWQPGSKVYVGSASRLLGEDGLDVGAGDLIRVVRARQSPPSVVSLATKLVLPGRHLRKLHVSGFPGDPRDSQRHCLLQPLEAPRLVHYAGLRGPSLLDQVLLSHAAPWPGPLRLLWPRRQIRDVVVRACAIAAVFPRNELHFAPVIVDAREICHAVQVRATKVGNMTLDAFMDGVGLRVPDSGDLVVTGTAVFDVQTRAITVAANDVVELRYRNQMDSIWASIEESSVVDVAPGEAALDGTRPCMRQPATSVPGLGSRDRFPRRPTEHGSSGHRRVSVHCMQDLWRLMGKRALLVDPISAALRRVNAFRSLPNFGAHSAIHAPVVFQDGEAQMHILEVSRPEPMPPQQPDTPDPEANGSEADSQSYLPDILCLKVAVVPFQGPVCYHSLWYEEGEDTSSLMVRANILLHDDPDFVVLVPSDPQPDMEHLTLLLFPQWWRLVGMKPILVQTPLLQQPAFVQVAFPGQTAEEFVPQAAIPSGVRCAARAPASSAHASMDLDLGTRPADVLPEASLVCLHHFEAPAPTAPTLRSHLAGMVHVLPEATPAPAPPLEERLAVLLGFGFDSLFVTLTIGPVKECVANALGIPIEHIYIRRQWPTFDQLVVATALVFEIWQIGDDCLKARLSLWTLGLWVVQFVFVKSCLIA